MAGKRQIRVCPTYAFKGQDPILAKLRSMTIREAAARGITFKAMVKTSVDLCRLSPSTVGKWFTNNRKKQTMRPQHWSVNGYARTMDMELDFVPVKRSAIAAADRRAARR